MKSLKNFFKGCPKNVKSIEFDLEQKIEDPQELKIVKEEIKKFKGVAKPGVAGRKSIIKYKVYKDAEFVATVYGITNTMNYIKKNYNSEMTKSKVTSLTRCYACDCKFRKAKNYEKYNGLEIELIGK